MGGGHLGERVAALVDDELSHGARDRVLAHLATCEQCRGEVEAARALKRRLADLGAPRPAVEPSADLLLTLMKLGDVDSPSPPFDASLNDPGVAAMRSWLGSSRPQSGPQVSERAIVGPEAAARSRAAVRRPLRSRAATVGAFSMVAAAATLGSAVMLGVNDGTVGGAAHQEPGVTQPMTHQHAVVGHDTTPPDSVMLTDMTGVPHALSLHGSAGTTANIPLALPTSSPSSSTGAAAGGTGGRQAFGAGGLMPTSFGSGRSFGGSNDPRIVLP